MAEEMSSEDSADIGLEYVGTKDLLTELMKRYNQALFVGGHPTLDENTDVDYMRIISKGNNFELRGIVEFLRDHAKEKFKLDKVQARKIDDAS
jgi:hypothetical protein